MKLALITDAWLPQINGVVTTMRHVSAGVAARGHEVLLITPAGFRSIPCPGYREIRLSVTPYRGVARTLEAAQPDAIHIATEGPLGWAARRFCRRNGLRFASSLHTRFPDYLRMRLPVPVDWSWNLLRRFHAAAHCTLVRTRSQRQELQRRGFQHLEIWPGAVDTSLFRPRGKDALSLPRPVALFVGRVAVEKGLPDFLSLDLPGSKVIIGGGPDLDRLQARFPDAHFLGPRFGEELASLVSAADVFVFPSRTDTFGLVLLEAMACGVPVAAFPVPGPRDLVIDGSTGALDDDLAAAFHRALALDGDAAIEFALDHSWERSTDRFLSFQQPTRPSPAPKPIAAPESETNQASPVP